MVDGTKLPALAKSDVVLKPNAFPLVGAKYIRETSGYVAADLHLTYTDWKGFPCNEAQHINNLQSILHLY